MCYFKGNRRVAYGVDGKWAEPRERWLPWDNHWSDICWWWDKNKTLFVMSTSLTCPQHLLPTSAQRETHKRLLTQITDKKNFNLISWTLKSYFTTFIKNDNNLYSSFCLEFSYQQNGSVCIQSKMKQTNKHRNRRQKKETSFLVWVLFPIKCSSLYQRLILITVMEPLTK